MILMTSTAALQSGLTIVAIKLLTELAQAGDFNKDNIGLIIILVVIMGFSGTMQLHILNLAMKYFD